MAFISTFPDGDPELEAEVAAAVGTTVAVADRTVGDEVGTAVDGRAVGKSVAVAGTAVAVAGKVAVAGGAVALGRAVGLGATVGGGTVGAVGVGAGAVHDTTNTPIRIRTSKHHLYQQFII